jgi:hypothetical protein
MSLTDADLEAYLDEALPADQMAAVEQALRGDSRLLARLAAINGRRDAGAHTLGEIWRRHRLTCPTRDQWGSFLLGALGEEEADYLRFHLQVVGCRACAANVEDLRRQQQEAPQATQSRRRKYFESSAGYLRKR